MEKCKHNWDTEQKLVFGPIQMEQVKIDANLCPNNLQSGIGGEESFPDWFAPDYEAIGKIFTEMFLENQNKMHIQEEILNNWKVWNKFKKLFPNSPEVYPHYSRENIARWNYHIAHAEKGEKFEPVVVDKTLLEMVRLERAVSVFERFKNSTADKYREIASLYPGVQVYACGSRVRGDWWDSNQIEWPNTDIILQARHEGGMRTDKFSDYDFWVPADALPERPLPVWADRFRGKFNEKEMVAIPICNGI